MSEETMSWKDNYDLKFWCWAYMKNAEDYISANSRHMLPVELSIDKYGEELKLYFEKRNVERYQDELARYNFIAVLGSLIRALKRFRKLSPEIEAVCSEAVHLFTEGPELRNMVEHADEYYARAAEVDNSHWKPEVRKRQERFVRSSNILGGVTADATSVVAGDGEHWLGGRFCVEISMNEVQRIYDVAISLPVPSLELNVPPAGNLLD